MTTGSRTSRVVRHTPVLLNWSNKSWALGTPPAKCIVWKKARLEDILGQRSQINPFRDSLMWWWPESLHGVWNSETAWWDPPKRKFHTKRHIYTHTSMYIPETHSICLEYLLQGITLYKVYLCVSSVGIHGDSCHTEEYPWQCVTPEMCCWESVCVTTTVTRNNCLFEWQKKTWNSLPFTRNQFRN